MATTTTFQALLLIMIQYMNYGQALGWTWTLNLGGMAKLQITCIPKFILKTLEETFCKA